MLSETVNIHQLKINVGILDGYDARYDNWKYSANLTINEFSEESSYIKVNPMMNITDILSQHGVSADMDPTTFELGGVIINYALSISPLDRTFVGENEIYVNDSKKDTFIDMGI